MRKILIAVFLCGLLTLGAKLAFTFSPSPDAHGAEVPAGLAKEIAARWESVLREHPGAELSLRDKFKLALEIEGDHPEIVPYLIGEGIFPDCPSYFNSSLEQCADWRDPKPETARALVQTGCDPTALLTNRRYRQFAVKAGLLDENGKPLVQGEPSPELAAYWEGRRQKARDWGMANPEEALISEWFYSAADPDTVRAVIGTRSLDRHFYEEYEHERTINTEFFGSWSKTTIEKNTLLPLCEAARFTPYPEVLAILAKAGARVHEELRGKKSPFLREAIKNPNPEVFKAALALKPDLPAVLEDRIWVDDALPIHIRLLAEAGFDFNKDTKLPLIGYALKYENLPAARALLQAGADPNRPGDFYNYSLNAMGEAIEHRYYSFAIELIEAGAEHSYAYKDRIREITMKQHALAYKPESPEQQKDYDRLLELLN
jgi:hypothetical protein